MESLDSFPAVADTRVTQEPVKVYLPKDRVSTFALNSRSSSDTKFLQEHTCLAEQNRALAEQYLLLHLQESSLMMSKARSEPSQLYQATMRTSISELSTNGSSGLASPHASDDEEDLVLPKATQTTVVMKNLSQSCTRRQIVELLDLHGFAGKYDLVYVPIDFTSMLSHCYAFVNFVSEEVALDFLTQGIDSKGFSQSACVGEGGSKMDWASGMQGLQAAIRKYRNSPVMHALVPDECKPLLFESGRIASFPKPTQKIQKPRGLQRKSI
jgi:hypothetical protein